MIAIVVQLCGPQSFLLWKYKKEILSKSTFRLSTTLVRHTEQLETSRLPWLWLPSNSLRKRRQSFTGERYDPSFPIFTWEEKEFPKQKRSYLALPTTTVCAQGCIISEKDP